MGNTLLKKVWDLHTVRQLPSGQTQLFIGMHLVHEVTSPQAFDELRRNGWKIARPDRTFATVDHIVPTKVRTRPFIDVMAEDMMASLERNVRDFGLRFARFERTTESDSGSFATKMSQPPSLNAEKTTRSFSRDQEIENTPPIRSVSWRYVLFAMS